MFDLGQKIVCVDDTFPEGIGEWFNALPIKGRVYTVRDIIPAQGWQGEHTCAVLLAEVINAPDPQGRGEFGFAARRFREVDFQSVSLTQKEALSLTP